MAVHNQMPAILVTGIVAVVVVVALFRSFSCYHLDVMLDHPENYDRAWDYSTRPSLLFGFVFPSQCHNQLVRLYSQIFSDPNRVDLQFRVVMYLMSWSHGNSYIWDAFWEMLDGKEKELPPEDILKVHQMLGYPSIIADAIEACNNTSVKHAGTFLAHYRDKTDHFTPGSRLWLQLHLKYIASLDKENLVEVVLRNYSSRGNREIIGACIDAAYIAGMSGREVLDLVVNFSSKAVPEILLHHAIHYKDKVAAVWAVEAGAPIFPHLEKPYVRESLGFLPEVARVLGD